MAVTLTHTAEEGTLATGTDREMAHVFKSYRWRWSRNLAAWYVPQSRYKAADEHKINATADALRDAGFEVETEINHDRMSTAEREARKADDLAARQEALTAKTARKEAEANRHFGNADDIGKDIPFGQPILIGHHSERRARKDADRIWTETGKGVAAFTESEEAARKAQASERAQRQKQSGPATMRRLERLHTEARDIERKMQRAEEGGEWHTRLVDLLIDVNDQIVYWASHLEDLKDAGFKQWTPRDFTKGENIKVRGRVCQVVRVNAKSLSVTTGYSWTDRITYDERIEKIEMPAETAAD